MTVFDKRLEQYHCSPNTPYGVIKRAIYVYEDLKTSKIICEEVMGKHFTPELQISVFNALQEINEI